MECNIVKENAKFAKSEKVRELSSKITMYVRYSYLKNPRISVKIRGVKSLFTSLLVLS